MTKLSSIVFIGVLFAGLAGCDHKKEQEGKEPLNPPPVAAPAPTAPPAASPGSPSAAPGSAASAEAAPGSAANAPASAPVGCATASTLRCEAGQTDGCAGGLTAVHVCVAADAKPGSPCAEGGALTCPTGQIDACHYAPPYASNHICVFVPRPAP